MGNTFKLVCCILLWTLIVAKHEYDCGGGVVSELVYFNQNDEVYKTKYYEE